MVVEGPSTSSICPKCKGDTAHHHCRSPYCLWFMCFRCVPYGSVVIFRESAGGYWVKVGVL